MSNLDIKVFALGYNLSQMFSSATWDLQAFLIYLLYYVLFFSPDIVGKVCKVNIPTETLYIHSCTLCNVVGHL